MTHKHRFSARTRRWQRAHHQQYHRSAPPVRPRRSAPGCTEYINREQTAPASTRPNVFHGPMAVNAATAARSQLPCGREEALWRALTPLFAPHAIAPLHLTSPMHPTSNRGAASPRARGRGVTTRSLYTVAPSQNPQDRCKYGVRLRPPPLTAPASAPRPTTATPAWTRRPRGRRCCAASPRARPVALRRAARCGRSPSGPRAASA